MASGDAGNATTTPMTDRTRFPNARRPAWSNTDSSQGMGPLVFLTGAAWRGWNGALAVGVMADQRLDILTIDSAGPATGRVSTDRPGTRDRALTMGPDGSLSVATNGGEIWRVTPGA